MAQLRGEDPDTLTWEVELDRLELEILRVERLMKALEPLEAADWAEPTLPPPLPAHLLPRAIEIHERQAKALREIVRALHGTQRQRRYVEGTASEKDLVPRYLDITA